MRFRDWLNSWLPARSRPAHTSALREDAAIPDSAGEADVDLLDPFPEPVRLEIRDVFDLHTIPPRDVSAVVAEYLRAARAAGFRQVRLIHGKGKGVQRDIVRRILGQTSFVEDWRDAPPEAGGWGATIVRLSSKDD